MPVYIVHADEARGRRHRGQVPREKAHVPGVHILHRHVRVPIDVRAQAAARVRHRAGL